MANVLQYLIRSAERFPDKCAVTDDVRSYTYAEFCYLTRAIGSGLLPLTRPRQAVGVYLPKNAQAVAAFFGIQWAGCFYSVLNTELPGNRLRQIAQTLAPAVIVTCEALLPQAKEIFPDCPLVCLEALAGQAVDAEVLASVQARAIDTDPLYVNFTSGSTGVPKGVLVSHRSVINFTEWWCETFEFDENEVFANQTPFYFDASVKDIYATLRCGATMHIVPRKFFSLPKKLVHFLNEKRITCIDWVPSALCMIVNFRALDKEKPESLKKVMFLGEVMPTKQFNMWRKALPEVKYANLYGPTEATGDCTYYKIEREFEDTEPIPIGFACSNTEVMLLDGDTLVTEQDTVGEICVRGCSLAHGYFNNPEKTNEAFVRNPLQKNYYERIYRTGDLGKYNAYGEIVFLARKDSQIKHMGHRIELGEIETALSAVPGIRRGCCLYEHKTQKIVAIYEGSTEQKALTEALKEKLPNYMLPNRYVPLEEMPINLNGKIDRTLLKHQYIKEN